MKLYLLPFLLLVFTAPLQAQKMNILEFFEAFKSNTLSPNNEMKGLKMEIVQENGTYKMKNYKGKMYDLEVDKNLTFLRFKTPYKHQGDCYPTFKIYTKADGSQILAVTEDFFDVYTYYSKYSNFQANDIDEDFALLEKWKRTPFPVKFWTYKNGNWKDVTFEVVPEFFSYEEMIASMNKEVKLRKDVDLATHLAEEVSTYFHPLYELKANDNNIRVWVDAETLIGYSEGKEESSAYGNDDIAWRKLNYYFSFIDNHNTKFKERMLVWDAQKGIFTKK